MSPRIRALVAALAIGSSLFCRGAAIASDNHDPLRAVIETSDIERFWAAYDSSTSADRADVFQRRYLDPGTPGLRAFIPDRIKSAANLAEVVDAHPAWYGAVRASSLRVRDQVPAMRKALVAMAQLVDGAVFPPVYFVIGAMNSGGTDKDAGLIIGTELETLPLDHPAAACRGAERLCTVATPPDRLPFIVAHELTHYQQAVVRRGRAQSADTVLSQALDEGVADYVGSLVSGLPVKDPYTTYGRAHAAEVREAFRADASSHDLGDWFYRDPKRHAGWPHDMGYFVGYEIADRYVRRAANRKAAVRALLDAADPAAILRESGYLDDAQPNVKT